MSKNLTRKGLAFGALVALASTVIAGTPASAAGEVVFAPSTGTSYNTFVTDTLTLNASLAPGQVAGNIAQLKYSVVTDGSFVLKAVATSTTATTAYSNTGNVTGVGVAPAYVPTTSFVVAPGTPTASTTNTIALSVDSVADATTATTGVVASATTATKSAVVTAFIDSNNNSVADAGEFSQARTVKFVKYSEVVPVVTLTTPNLGDASLKATATVGDLFIGTAADLTVTFTGATGVDAAPGVTATSGVFTDGTISGIATTTAVTAQAYYKTVALGTAVSATATARTISSIAANVVTGSNAIAATTAAAGNSTTTGASASVVVRKDSAWVAQAKVLDTATTAVAKAGVAVVATVTTAGTLTAATTSASAVSVTVNGTTYTAKTGNVVATVNLTSDASGLVSLPVATAGGLTSAVVVTFVAQNYDAAVSATPTAATYTVTDDRAAVIVATNKNTAVSYALSVKDQFGVLSTRTNERVLVAATQQGATIANQFIPVSGGKASFSITPGTDITANITVEADLQVSTTNATTGVTTWATGGTDIADRTIVVRTAAYSITVDPAVSHVAGAAYNATTNATQAQTGTALADIALTSAASTGDTTWARVAFTGSNTGESITVTGTGVMLSIDGAAATANSATAIAQGTVVVVHVASNIAGAKTLTVSNGSVSKTVSVTFGAAAATAGKTITFVGATPTSATPGSTFTVSAKLVDVYGNNVQASAAGAITVTYVGPGFVVGSTLPTATNASGELSFQVLSGAADSGTGTVTVTYDADGSAGSTSVAVVKTTTVLVAAPEVAATIAAATGKINFTIDNAKGELVIIKVANKTVKRFVAYSNAHAFGIKATKGSKAVKVYVAGDLVAAKTVAVK